MLKIDTVAKLVGLILKSLICDNTEIIIQEKTKKKRKTTKKQK